MTKVSSKKSILENPTRSNGDLASKHSRPQFSLPAIQDRRPATIVQRKLQDRANYSPQAKQLKRYQDLANHSPQATQAAQMQLMADQYSASLPIQKENLVSLVEPNNTGLPDSLKSGIEALSGYSMDDVRVHPNSEKPAQFQAEAYAQGTEIHLASGEEKHLPHEAWHVVQQKQGRVKPTLQMKNGNVNNDAGLEQEADQMGSKAVQIAWPLKNQAESNVAKNNGPIRQFKRSASDVDMDSFEYIPEREKPISKEASEKHYTNSLAKGKTILKDLEEESVEESSESESLDDVQVLDNDVYKIGQYYHKIITYDAEDGEYGIKSTRDASYKTFPYQNDFEGSKLTAENNHRDKDYPADTAVHNSTLLWMQYRALKKHRSEKDQEAPALIKKVERVTVTNPQTRHTIWWCDGGEAANDDYQDVTLSGNPEDFTALLGTPNGRSTGFLLIQHKDMMAGSELGKITYTSDSLKLRIE